MSAIASTVYDVFLSHGQHDIGVGRIVRDSFRSKGLDVFSASKEFRLGDPIAQKMREALAKSAAVVILLTRSTLKSPYVAFEVGAAMSQAKPVFVVYDGIAPTELPGFLDRYPVVPLANLADVVKQVRDLRERSLSN